MCQAQGEILFAELILNLTGGRKVPFKGQSVSGFQFRIFFSFKVFPSTTQTSDLRSFSDVLHVFILYWYFWNNSTLNPKIVK